MFGEPLKEHTDRYAQAAEWMDIWRRLWTEREFDFDGKYYKIAAGESFPQPLQQPFPPIMNAGGSDTGRAFATSASRSRATAIRHVGCTAKRSRCGRSRTSS